MSFLLCALAASSLHAQKSSYEPRESWPYLYAEFEGGEVFTLNGELVKAADLNVSVSSSTLHFIEDGTIMEANMITVGSVRIGKEYFVNRGGALYRIVRRSSGAMIVEGTEIDRDRMNRTDIGYGISSATASSANVTILSETGSDMVNLRLVTAIEKRGQGKILPLKKTLYILTSGLLIEASKREVLDIDGLDRAKASAFIKESRIKWRDPDSLLQLADYICNNLTVTE